MPSQSSNASQGATPRRSLSQSEREFRALLEAAVDAVLVIDRATWQAARDELLAREKAHTREGDAIAAAHVQAVAQMVGQRLGTRVGLVVGPLDAARVVAQDAVVGAVARPLL